MTAQNGQSDAQAIYLLVEEQRRARAAMERLAEALEAIEREREDDELLFMEDVMNVLGASRNTVQKMMGEGLPLFKLPGDSRWRITKKALWGWIGRQARR